MSDLKLLESAIELAVEAHRGQFDADGTPHIVHAMEVMLSVREREGERTLTNFSLEELLVVAILHDTVEDSPENVKKKNSKARLVTLGDIEAKYGIQIASAVDGVSRRPKEDYRDFIYRVRLIPAAVVVKAADLLSNLKRNQSISDAKWREKLWRKYTIALAVLTDDDQPTWEQAGWHIKNDKLFVPDPNGNMVEHPMEYLKVIRAGRV